MTTAELIIADVIESFPNLPALDMARMILSELALADESITDLETVAPFLRVVH
jgi:hypothetical protein